MLKTLLFVILVSHSSAGDASKVTPSGQYARKIIEAAGGANCSATTVVLDDYTGTYITEFTESMNLLGGLTVFSTNVDNSSIVAENIVKSRKTSLCNVIIVLGRLASSLSKFAELALEHRIIGSFTKLLVITDLNLKSIKELMVDHYTFGWMNTVFVTNDNEMDYSSYVYLPYNSENNQFVRTSKWVKENGVMQVLYSGGIFPQKYENFHGKEVNVTALPFAPYWDAKTVKTRDGSEETRYSGCDYELILAVAKALNFRMNVMPSKNWGEVTQSVQDRKSFVASVIYAVFPERLKMYDYSVMFSYAPFSFSLLKPALKPQWQALYYPLTDEVWLSVIITIIIMIPPFAIINFFRTSEKPGVLKRIDIASQSVVAALLSQSYPDSLPKKNSSSSILMGFWLLTAFIIATAYRTNLTASLTLPKYPPRIESLSELVSIGKEATMPSYGKQFKKFFETSTSGDFKKLSQRIQILSSAAEGLQSAIKKGTAHMEARPYMQMMIAKEHTDAYGTSSLYIARDSIFPGLSAWPITHDAPYKESFNKAIQSVIESGLYKRWHQEHISNVRTETRLKKMEELEEKDLKIGTDNNLVALTMVHMQGPFIILVLGSVMGVAVFLLELAFHKYANQK